MRLRRRKQQRAARLRIVDREPVHDRYGSLDGCQGPGLGLAMIWALLLGFALFGDFPDGWTWTGAAVIIASGLYVAYRESRQGNK